MNDQEMAAHLSKLINRGRFRKAAAVGSKYVANNPDCDDANLWFQLSLAEGLGGFPRRAAAYRCQASLCSNYTSTMRGDFFRDAALAAIRRGDALQAKDFLDQADAEVPEGDGNRQAAISMVSGRILLLLDLPFLALTCFYRAIVQFDQLGENADAQWVKNNNFHTLRALAACAIGASTRPVTRSLRRMITQSDPNRLRRYRAWGLCYLGRTGYVMDRRVFGD